MYNDTIKIISLIITLLFSVPATSQEPWDYTYPKREERAVWLATIGGIDWPRTKATNAYTTEAQKQELRTILDRLQRANINTVILQTRIRGSVIYPSDIETWDEAITGRAGRAPGYDPLQFAIEECHARGMELHAWLVSIPLGTYSRQYSYGTKSVMRHHPSLCKTVRGEVFMIPGQPATADYIASIAKEIVERYDVDGISLDYIRYPESTYYFSDDNLYSSSTGMTISEWRRSNITRIVKRVHDVVKAIKPWVKLSSSPIGKYSNLSRYRSGGWDCFNAVYQDPKAWLRDNIQDLLFPMMYFTADNFYPFLYDWAENCYGHPIAAGLGIYFLDPHEGPWQLNDVRAEMYETRRSGIGGIAFYRSDYLTRNLKGIYDSVSKEFFPYPALTSRMTWMPDTIAPPAPQNMKYENGIISWQYDHPATHGQWPFISFNIYGSNHYPVDTDKAENLLAHHIDATNFTIAGRATTKHYFAITAIDRFGNESHALQEPPATTIHHSHEEIMAAISRHYNNTQPAATASTPSNTNPTSSTSLTRNTSPTRNTSSTSNTGKSAKPAKRKKKEPELIITDFSKYFD